MRSSIDSHSPGSNRLVVVSIIVLVLGAAWTFVSREPATQAGESMRPSSPKEGFPAPDFTLTTLEGDQLVLSGLQGHPVVLNFWASWCLPCRAEMPAIEEVYRRYRDAGLVVVGVNLTSQDSESAVSEFVQEFDLTFPIALDPDGTAQGLYRLLGLPSTYFIDEGAIIRSIIVGGPMSEALIQSRVEDLLQEK